jgi:hypothetical protein
MKIKFGGFIHRTIFAPALKKSESVAQLVEQYTFNVWVSGSNPDRLTEKLKILLAKAGFFFAFEKP